MSDTEHEKPNQDDPESRGGGVISKEAIAARAYEISLSEDGGTSEENWQRAERELREASGEGVQ